MVITSAGRLACYASAVQTVPVFSYSGTRDHRYEAYHNDLMQRWATLDHQFPARNLTVDSYPSRQIEWRNALYRKPRSS